MNSSCHPCPTRLLVGCLFILGLTIVAKAQTALDEESPWPRVRTTNGNTVTLHLPQVEQWTSNSFTARAAVQVKPAKSKTELFGVIWFDAHGWVDHSTRLVTLDQLVITKGRFPDAPDKGSNALAIVHEVLPSGARTVSLDYLITALGFAQAAARQGASGLKRTPPDIIWATNRAVLIRIDGEPVLRPIGEAPNLERVINTPALLVHDKAGAKFYLSGGDWWFAASSIKGPWSLAQSPPAEVAALVRPLTNTAPAHGQGNPPRIIVSTTPAELLLTSGLPDFKPIRGTALQYAADSDNQLFFHTSTSEAYLLIAGRWFKAKSLNGPWTYVAPHDLPADFARIPPGSPQAIVLASVPETTQAELALLANSVPTTATVDARTATIKLTYDGEPKFKPIEGTKMSYAINADLPVILAGSNYYAVDSGVWFLAKGAMGPWKVAPEVPEEIYSIPPSSPVYYATFVRVYDASDEEVEVGYTSGYQGAYEDDGTMVYGTGWEYEPWYGDDYYGWGWTWGYSYVYVPWYQWWVWRPWWNEGGGLRAAVIENVYDRWQGRNGVTHYDRAADGISTPPTTSGGISKPPTTAGGISKPATGEDIFKPATGDQIVKPPTKGAGISKPPTTDAGISKPPTTAEGISKPATGEDIFKPPGTPGASGYSALYGRFKGSTGAAPLAPPANTLALNPYSRPATPGRAGEVPKGAQLLTTVRKAPGGGRDLYASPDGGIYRRQNDGWYRRQGNGQWKFAAPAQGPIVANQKAAGAGAGQVLRPSPGSPGPGRVPNTGFEARAQDVAALERQYYARAMAEMRAANRRAANYRAANNRGRPMRSGGRRR